MYLKTYMYGGNEHHFQEGRGKARREVKTEQPVTSAGCKALARLSQTPCGSPASHVASPLPILSRAPRGTLSTCPESLLSKPMAPSPPPSGSRTPRQMGCSLAHTETALLGE